MKKILCLLLFVLMLSGCGGKNVPMDRMLELRSSLLSAKSCAFDARITADYGDKTYTFSMHCTADPKGNLQFAVTEPETIAGIAGKIEGKKGSLTFDDTVLAFELLCDDQLTPVSAPWVLLTALRGGYVSDCGEDGNFTRVTLQDSFGEDALTVALWLDGDRQPVHGEILWKERKILTMEIKNFTLL